MMKNLLLLMASGAICTGAMAQQSVVFNETQKTVKETSLPSRFTKQGVTNSFQQMKAARQASNNVANKGNQSGVRTYNYVDLLITQTPNTASNQTFPYMWGSFNAFANFTGGYDTVNTGTFGQVIQPWYNKWNSQFGFPNEKYMEMDALYKLDTVKIYGLYATAANKQNIVDTMIVKAFYGNGAGGQTIEVRNSLSSTPNSIAAEFNVPSLLFDLIPIDSVRYTARLGSNAPANSMVERKILMRPNMRDTTDGGFDVIRVPVGLSIPAGNMVGATFTFKSGDPSFVPYDTILVSATPNNIIKYNFFRPSAFEQNDQALPTYYADSNFNNGMFFLFPFDQGDFFYLPMYFFTAPSRSEFINMDFVISSNQFGVSVPKTNLVKLVGLYPNPANTEITIPVKLAEATDLKVTITNTVGQVLKTQTISKAGANTQVEVRFNTSDLANGMYFYTVEAGGQRASERFVITH